MEPFMGMIQQMGFYFAPNYWANCDGSLLPISQNSALYTLLNTQFGGDGRTTYALPDLRGRMAMGQGQGSGLTPRVMGQVGGAESVSLLVSNLPPHAHQVSLGGSTSGTGGTMAAAGSGAVTPMPSSVAGEGLPVSTMSPMLVVNCQIALQGIYPSRS
jgi:microcystin-dependent protein